MTLTLSVAVVLLLLVTWGLWTAQRRRLHEAAQEADSPSTPPTPLMPLPAADQPWETLGASVRQALQSGTAPASDPPLVSMDAESLTQPWPLDMAERRTRVSRRLWFVDGNCQLPSDVHFAAAVVCTGDLTTRRHSGTQTLLAHARVRLSPHTQVGEWVRGLTIEAQEGCGLGRRAVAQAALHVAPGVRFTELEAPVIRCVDSSDRPGASSAGIRGPLTEAEGVHWDRHHQRGQTLSPVRTAALRTWAGDLISRSDLILGEGAHVRGNLRCQGDLTLRAGCRIEGSIVAYGEIFVAPGCQVTGSIQSEAQLTLGPGCVIGTLERPSVVRVARLTKAPGVILHAEIWVGSDSVEPQRRLRKAPRQHDATAIARPSDASRLILGLAPVTAEGAGRTHPGDWALGLPADSWISTEQGARSDEATAQVKTNHAWEGDLDCAGDLRISEGCRAIGRVRAQGDVNVDAGTLLMGSIECRGVLRIHGGNQIGGALRSAQAIHIGPGCVIGTPSQPVTVLAPEVTLGLGTVVHGRVVAGPLGGHCTLPVTVQNAGSPASPARSGPIAEPARPPAAITLVPGSPGVAMAA